MPLSLIHIYSIYVDQWDWEKVISKEERNMETLQYTVRKVYSALKETEDYISRRYNYIEPLLPDDIFFITSQELEDLYPGCDAKEREHLLAKEKGAIFVAQIGKVLASGEKHDGRAPDYDDWELNGDIIVYYPVPVSYTHLPSFLSSYRKNCLRNGPVLPRLLRYRLLL